MPIVDGFSSTKMIRSSEKVQALTCLSSKAGVNGRIPIFAVSASLTERERDKYIDTGFDGWILKPVDFKRVDLFLKGIVDDQVRDTCLYEQGHWEAGGWFKKRNEDRDMFSVDTGPSEQAPTTEATAMVMEGNTSNPVSVSEGSVTPTPETAGAGRHSSDA